MRIYVGNLSYETTNEDIHREFAAFGEVKSAEIMSDRLTGQSKGFGFVEMSQISEGQAAIANLNGKTIDNRMITVNPARDRAEGGGGRSFGGNRGGSGGFHGKKKGGGSNKGKQRRY